MERHLELSENAMAHEEQRILSYVKKHGLKVYEKGRAIICRGRNDSYLSFYARVWKDTKGDKNAKRHGYPLGVECIVSILENKGRITCVPLYTGITIIKKD